MNAQRNGNFQVIGNIGSGHNQTSGYGEKLRKAYLKRTRKPLESTIMIKVINTWPIPN